MKKKTPEYAVFILSNRRPDRVYTYDTLRRQGYTGRIFIIVDDEDPTQDEYKAKYGEEVQVFDKKKAVEYTDTCDNRIDRNSVVYARNACYGIARKLGLQCFIVLDDDYTSFQYKYDENLQYMSAKSNTRVKSIDAVINKLVEYYYSFNVKCLAISQEGDFIGGIMGSKGKKLMLWRKTMNFFICDTDREINFKGRTNEDVNTYIEEGMRGDLFLTVPNVGLTQKETQQNRGGLTEMYIQSGTYVKSFYTVMVAPSCTRIKKMGQTLSRWHHNIIWNSAVPAILRERWKKVKDDGRE